MRENVLWIPSPNFRTPKPPRGITLIVLHATETAGIQSPLDWLRNKKSKASAHYLIGKDGIVFQLVDEIDITWHAGISAWKGQIAVNNFSIGIELVNLNNGKDSWPDDQIRSCARISAGICKDHKLSADSIVGHFQISPGRKTDPVNFPWEDFHGKLINLGVGEAV